MEPEGTAGREQKEGEEFFLFEGEEKKISVRCLRN
jgi:hypothetical protein